MTQDARIDIGMPRPAVGGFAALLGQGVGIDVPLGISIHDLLSIHLDFGTAYVTDCIQTIFMDGRVVDREREAVVTDGAVIALSAAMPGLVGATLRKGGFYRGMRTDISQLQSISDDRPARRGRVVLKLFNIIAREMGPRILSQGVWVSGMQMADTLKMLSSLNLYQGCTFLWNGESVNGAGLSDRLLPDADLFLKVDFKNLGDGSRPASRPNP